MYIQINKNSLFEEIETNGINVKESTENYIEMLQDEFPNAEIELGSQYILDNDSDMEDSTIHHKMQKIYESEDWIEYMPEQQIIITDSKLIESYFECDPDRLEWLTGDDELMITLDHEKRTAQYELNQCGQSDYDNYNGVIEWLQEHGLENDNEIIDIEKLSDSLLTSKEVIEFLSEDKKMSEKEIKNMITEAYPTQELTEEIFENYDIESFFWGDYNIIK